MHTDFNPNLYQGRTEPYENHLAQYYYQHIKAYHNQPICLIGFGCDQGVNRNQGRIGAKHSPDNIKTAFGKLPIHWQLQKHFDDLNNLNNLDNLDNLANLIGDDGNIICDDDNVIQDNLLEATQKQYADKLTFIIKNHSLPIGIGGGHEIAFGSFMGLYNAVNIGVGSKKTIGIINLDAHFDLRSDKYATSGTPFLQIANFLKDNQQAFYYLPIGISEFGNTASLFAKADNLGVNYIGEKDCFDLSFDAITTKIDEFIGQVDYLYLTLDLDCLQASFMPAVSAVNAKGLPLDFVEKVLNHIIKSKKVKIIDIAEFNPTYDIDGRGAKVVARILTQMVMAYCLR